MWDWLKEWFSRGSSDPSDLADYDRMVANIGTVPSGIEEITVTGHRLEPVFADPPVNVNMVFEPGSPMVDSGWDNGSVGGTGSAQEPAVVAIVEEEEPASAAAPAEEPDSVAKAEDAPAGIEELIVTGHRPAPAPADPSVNVHVMFELGSSTADSGWDNGGAGGTSSAQEAELVAAIEEEPVDSAEEEEKSLPAQTSTKKPPAGIEEVTVTGHQVKPAPPIKSGLPINITLESGSSTIDLSGDSAGGGGTNSAHAPAPKTVAIVEEEAASAADPVEEEEDSALAQTDTQEPPSGIEEIIVIGHRNEPPPMVTTDENGVVRVNFGWGSVESGATASKGSSAASALALLSRANSGVGAISGGVELTSTIALNSGDLYSIKQISSAMNAAKYTKELGIGGAALGIGIDLYLLLQDEITTTKFGVDAAMTALTIAGPEFAPVTIPYWGLEATYPGGALGLLEDNGAMQMQMIEMQQELGAWGWVNPGYFD